MANTATRLITLIMLLQRQPNQSATQLARELNVSVRTVQRYISLLDEMGIPVYAERGPGAASSSPMPCSMSGLPRRPGEESALKRFALE